MLYEEIMVKLSSYETRKTEMERRKRIVEGRRLVLPMQFYQRSKVHKQTETFIIEMNDVVLRKGEYGYDEDEGKEKKYTRM